MTVRPGCEWVGVDETDETAVVCGRPATEVIRERNGRRHFACAEHVASVRAKASGARPLHRIQGRLPARPYPEAIP